MTAERKIKIEEGKEERDDENSAKDYEPDATLINKLLLKQPL